MMDSDALPLVCSVGDVDRIWIFGSAQGASRGQVYGTDSCQ